MVRINLLFLALGIQAVWIAKTLAGPAELNYQGVLLDSSGNGVTGTRAMTLKLYDAAIGGNLLYTEDLGNVSVNKGVYSFNFGTNGTANPKVTEIVAIANGTTNTFQKIFANTNVVTGSVSVTDGTYTWDQANGSSDGGVNFDASYSSSLRRITVNYYNTAPVAGKTIRVTYRSPSAGLAGILANENDPWLEISVGGAPQSPRSKLTAAPFSLRAARVDEQTFQETKEIDFPIKRVLAISSYPREHYGVPSRLPVGVTSGPYNDWESQNIIFDFPFFIKEIISLTINYSVTKLATYGYPTYYGRIDLSLLDGIDQTLVTFAFPRSETNNAVTVIPINKVVANGDSYRLSVIIQPGNNSGSFEKSYGGGSINEIVAKVKVPKSLALP